MTVHYIDFSLTDGSRICVQRHDSLLLMPNIQSDGSIAPHAHEYYEIVLIRDGSCRHFYDQDETILLPGDLFVIAPHRVHAYQFAEDLTYYNCQFFTEALGSEWLEDLKDLTYDRLQDPADDTGNPGMGKINRRGILHLDRSEIDRTSQYFELILEEQNNPKPDTERMKRCVLQMVLCKLLRLREIQFSSDGKAEQWKEQMVSETLARFENDLSGDWDTDELASRYNISSSYFRSVFREITGFPPRHYLNRLRILHAVRLIHYQGMSLNDASQAIGIFDLNYFSRLCKNITGYSPSHFRRSER
ncbi:MAG: AraC family transcriptional regulator [Flexilinea sp.]|nr:AraC family transcriptional regulator [Flexilinea sp.]